LGETYEHERKFDNGTVTLEAMTVTDIECGLQDRR